MAAEKGGLWLFLVCLFLLKQSVHASLSPKPDQNELVSPSVCDPFAKSLLRLRVA